MASQADGTRHGESVAATAASADDALVDELLAAVGRLEVAADRQAPARRATFELEETVLQLEGDRSELARKLDAAEARVARLEAVNREVSAQLVQAMEKVRALLAYPGGGEG